MHAYCMKLPTYLKDASKEGNSCYLFHGVDCWAVDMKICHNNVSLIKTCCSYMDIEQGFVRVET